MRSGDLAPFRGEGGVVEVDETCNGSEQSVIEKVRPQETFKRGPAAGIYLARSRVERFMIEKHALTLRLVSTMGVVSLLTFGSLVEAYKVLAL